MKVSIGEALKKTRLLLAEVTDVADLEAQVLLSNITGKNRASLLTWPEQVLSAHQYELLSTVVERRLNKEPLAYIVKQKEFWSLNFKVNPSTLIPRPETELLVDWVCSRVSKRDALKIADLGTGSGVIAISLATELKAAQIVAVELDVAALTTARENAKLLGVQNVAFYQGSWCHALPKLNYDFIVSNPPYLSEKEWEENFNNLQFEPKHALVAGKTGLESIIEIIETAKNFLSTQGYLLIEHGWLQGIDIRSLFQKAGYRQVTSLSDLSGKERITIGLSPF